MPQNLQRGVELPQELAAEVPTDKPNYLGAFGAGVDPRGTWTLELGRRTDPKHYGTMQALGTTGGFLGGAAVIPGIIGGLARVIPLLRGKKLGMKGLGKEFWTGASDIYKRVWSAVRGRKALKSAVKGKRALTDAERKLVTDAIGKNVSIGDVTRELQAKGVSVTPEMLSQVIKDPQLMRAAQIMTPGAKLSRGLVDPVVKELRAAGTATQASTPGILRGKAGWKGVGRSVWHRGPQQVMDTNKAVRILEDAARSGRALTSAERAVVESAAKGTATFGDVLGRLQSSGLTADPNVARQLFQSADVQRLGNIFGGRQLSPEDAQELIRQLGVGALMGGLAITGAGGITGYSAYKQYALGQMLRKEQEEARRRTEEAYRRGRLGKYSSERIGIIKQALEQYDPTPFSGLTAISDYVANRKHAAKPPKKPNSRAQQGLEAAKEALPPANERVVDKVIAARQTALA